MTGGTLTVFDPKVAHCTPLKVSKGEPFVEPANHVHLARNDGKTPVTLYALSLGIPKTTGANNGQSAPAGCNAERIAVEGRRAALGPAGPSPGCYAERSPTTRRRDGSQGPLLWHMGQRSGGFGCTIP